MTSRIWPVMTLALAALVGCQSVPQDSHTMTPAPTSPFGVLVMAHGGGPTWDAAIQEAVAPLKTRQPTAIAFGMADADTMAAAVRELEQQGVRRIGVVRLFVSGESFRTETEQVLGLREGAPPADSVATTADHHSNHVGDGHHNMAFYRINSQARFVLSEDGLLDAPEMASILASRARALSQQPSMEDVLILAHGPGDDGENQRWLDKLRGHAAALRTVGPFNRVQVATLREDWPEARAKAEAEIRAFVQQASAEGRTTLVLPFRVFGFGPYKKVLEGLSYRADGHGLLPHPAITTWLQQQADMLAAASE
ncbi:MAG: hypothetical protein ACOY3E_16360 [Pseudomonadota bacterium]